MTDQQKFSDRLEVKVLEGGQMVAAGSSLNGVPVEVVMPSDVKWWSPDLRFYMIWKLTCILEIN